MSLEPGSLLNRRYRILEVLSKGGMGAIYHAMDETLGIEVAVKENLFTTEDYSRQFRREASILAWLKHSNLPRVTDHFVIEGQGQYLVMDHIAGEDLRQYILNRGPLPEGEILRIGVAVCGALDYLHSRRPPIIHRDIKTGNIRITPGGQVYLVDFGLAKVEETGRSAAGGALALTPGYAPPEQYGGSTDARSDIYSLAATLYMALTASLPEDGLSRAMKTSTLTRVRQRNSKISEQTALVIEKALSLDPAERYQTAVEFRQALQGALNVLRGSAQPEAPAVPQAQALHDPAPVQVRPHPRIPKWLLLAAIGVLLILLAAFLALIHFG